MAVRSSKPHYWLSATLAVVVWGLFAGSAGASSSIGTLKFSGAVHGSYRLTMRVQCNVAPFPGGKTVQLDGRTMVNPATGRLGGYYPDLNITRLKHASTKANLATTKAYDVEFTNTGGATWASGYSGGGVPNGTGSLTMSTNGETGSISTTMVHYAAGAHGHVKVTATWHC
jgi:hypothetical protein